MTLGNKEEKNYFISAEATWERPILHLTVKWKSPPSPLGNIISFSCKTSKIPTPDPQIPEHQDLPPAGSWGKAAPAAPRTGLGQGLLPLLQHTLDRIQTAF